MSLLPFGSLPPHRPRQFLQERIDLGNWSAVAPWFHRLLANADQCKTGTELERWLRDWSELSAVLDEESSRRYIAMTCHTEDAQAEAAYLHFVEKIEPETKPRQFALARAYVNHPARAQLPKFRYEVFDRDTRNQVELFRPENVPLETQEAKLSQQYQKITGSLMVQFRGTEHTLVQMGRYLEEPDRFTRKEAWEVVANRRLEEAEKFDQILDQLVRTRQQIARNAGFANYRDYAFRKLARFDYGPAECEAFHAGVESEIMPVVRQLQAERRSRLRLEPLRPWDTAVDPLGRSPLRPFENVEELIARTQAIFNHLDHELAQGFTTLQQLRLLDLDNRKGKAPGGYQSNLSESRLPFIFMNAVGIHRDVETLLHESGHAFHALATRDEDLFAYRNPAIEFCEVASMSMELLGDDFLREFYDTDGVNRARRAQLEDIVTRLAWIATIDAFQHWVYTHPEHSRAERDAAWRSLMKRFGGDVDWSGYEAALAKLWHKQLHIFIHAFYYIEYGIAQLGALQVWANSRRNKDAALQSYKKALRFGGSRPLPELFSTAGCKFEFTSEAIAPLMTLMRDEIARLPV